MMNRKGWLRILEASISVIIILSTLFYLYNQTRVPATYDLTDRAKSIVDEIAANESLRYEIMTAPSSVGSSTYTTPADVLGFVDSRIHDASLNFETKICPLDDVCGKSNFTGEVYSAERIISSSIKVDTPRDPRKIRLFIWRSV